MKKNHPNLNYLWGSLIVEELIRNGVDYFCVAPGSRSSALSMSVAQNEKAKSFVYFDERALGFHALGYASAHKKPCAIITTSGTAVANLLPAVIEASKKKLPLIILSADRPVELRQTGAHQTIDQVKIFGSYAKWFCDLPTPTKDIQPNFVLTTIDQACAMAKTSISGPVHINCMFREPLAPTKAKDIPNNYLNSIDDWTQSAEPFTKYVLPQNTVDKDSIKHIAEKLNRYKAGVIAVGKLSNEQDAKAVCKLSEKLNWPILADSTSLLRFENKHKNVIHYFDQILLNQDFLKSEGVEAVIQIGGRMTSKRFYQHLELLKLKSYLMVLNHPLRNDPLHNVTDRVFAPTKEFCRHFLSSLTQNKEQKFLAKIQDLNIAVDQAVEDFFKKTEVLTESETARLTTKLINKDENLFLSNSMPIREVDMYGDPRAQISGIAANRGASGIDGIIASAAGYTQATNHPTTLIIGDLAFLYDLNSLAMIKNLRKRIIIIIFNNNGGGIFSFLPIAQKNEHFEEYFGTPHNLKFKQTALMFGLNYYVPKSKCDFISDYRHAQNSDVSTIIEIKSNRQYNLDIHQKLQETILNTIMTRGTK